MEKKFVSLILALLLAISCLPLSVFASDNSEESLVSPETNAIIYAESTWAAPGETVEITINISNNPGIAGAKFSVSFDEKLTLVAIKEDGGAFEALDYTAPETITNSCVFNWDSLDAVATEDGTILTLVFAIAADATPNRYLDINLSCDYGDVYGAELESVAVTMVGGNLFVVNYIPGDVNGDGVVNGKDVTLIRRYNAGADVEINLAAADVNDDGTINGKDVTVIRRYNAGYDITPVPSTKCEHEIVAVEAKEATCTEAGNYAYWRCSVCDKCFSDESATVEIAFVQTIIPANGHTEVVDKAVAPTYDSTGLTEGLHCSVCSTVILAQEIIPVLEAEYYSITYSNLQGAVSPELTQYASHLGVVDTDMPVLVCDGYEFLGWYTDIENGVRVFDIKPGSTENYHLYARWKLIDYKITYIDAPVKNNPDTYTIKDTIILAQPEWKGLSFSHWTNEKGEEVDSIEAGSMGAMTLTAHWRSVENLSVPNTNDSFEVIYDEKLEQYYFIYELGTINNVVLNQHFYHKMDGTTSYSYEKEATVRVEEGVATNVAQTIIQSITQTQDWYEETEKIEQHSKTTAREFTLCPEIEVEGVKVKAFEASKGTTNFDFNSLSEINHQGESYSDNQESSTMVSSTLSYVHDTTTSVTHTVALDPAYSPVGAYRYVYAGDVRVYAIVTYDPNSGNYYLDTYSLMYRTFTTTIYELLPEFDSDVNLEPNQPFTFDIPIDKMKAHVDAAYYVQYDANGGEGNMPMSTLACDKEQTLPTNVFTKAGYIFSGWELEGSDTPIQDGANVTNLAGKGETITLVATWAPIPYTVQWAKGSHYSVAVKRTSSPNVGAATGQLANGDTVYYGDVLNITYTADTGYSISTSGKTCITITGNVTSADITAVTKPNVYKITFDSAGGSSIPTASYDYGSPTIAPANPELAKYDFAGWNFYNADTGASISFSLGSPMPAYNVKAVAKWTVKTTHTITYSGAMTVDDAAIYRIPGDLSSALDIDKLAELNATFVVTGSFHIREINKGYQLFMIATYPGDESVWTGITVADSYKIYGSGEIEHNNGDKGEYTYRFETTARSASMLKDYKAIYLFFSASGGLADDWELSSLTFTITFTIPQ